MLIGLIIVIFIVAVIVGIMKDSSASKKAKKNLLDQITKDDRLKDAKLFEGYTGYFIAVSKTGYIVLKTPDMESSKIVFINDINGFELVKDGISNSANAGSAIVGGLLFGGIGALIGGIGSSKSAISSLSFIFKLNDFDMPSIEIKFITSKMNTDSILYEPIMKTVNEVAGLLSFLEREYKC